MNICDPPYGNMSYRQKHFLGGLRSLWNPLETWFQRVWNPLETLWKHFETLLKPFGNPFEMLWNPLETLLKRFETLLKPFETLWKPFWNALKIWNVEHVGNPFEMLRILFENPIWKCREKNILLVCVRWRNCTTALHVSFFAEMLFCRMTQYWFIYSCGKIKRYNVCKTSPKLSGENCGRLRM